MNITGILNLNPNIYRPKRKLEFPFNSIILNTIKENYNIRNFNDEQDFLKNTDDFLLLIRKTYGESNPLISLLYNFIGKYYEKKEEPSKAHFFYHLSYLMTIKSPLSHAIEKIEISLDFIENSLKVQLLLILSSFFFLISRKIMINLSILENVSIFFIFAVLEDIKK